MNTYPAKNTKINLVDQAYDYIKEQIKTRQLPPGEVVSDQKISKELEISRTPVRDAIKRLEIEGFLTNDMGHGWRVFPLQLDDIKEIFEVKIELEGLMAKKAALCKDPQLKKQLKSQLDRLIQSTKDGEASEPWHEIDRELHDTIFAMAKNHRAEKIISLYNEQYHRIRVGMGALQGRRAQTLAEHESFVNAILEEDPRRAEEAMQFHLIGIQKDLEEILVHLILHYAKDGV